VGLFFVCTLAVETKTNKVMKKIRLSTIENKYVIVADGNKIVYDLDDERIFSIHSTGCGRGARFAIFNERAVFHTLVDTNKGIKYLKSCYFVCEFKPVKISDLIKRNVKAYNHLINDIKEYNDKVKEHYLTTKKAKEEAKNLPKPIIYDGLEYTFDCSKNGVDVYSTNDSVTCIVVKDGIILFSINGVCSKNFGFVDINIV